MGARSPEKFMDLGDVMVLAWTVICPAACDQSKNTLMKERIWINRVASELVFQPFMLTPARSMSM